MKRLVIPILSVYFLFFITSTAIYLAMPSLYAAGAIVSAALLFLTYRYWKVTEWASNQKLTQYRSDMKQWIRVHLRAGKMPHELRYYLTKRGHRDKELHATLSKLELHHFVQTHLKAGRPPHVVKETLAHHGWNAMHIDEAISRALTLQSVQI